MIVLGLLNLVLGTVYTCYGLMTIVDLRRGWATRGPSHFGLAWLAMAFTCGPHHLDHAAHLLLAGRPGTGLELLTVVVGLPAGVCWFLLRVEALYGGRGDRPIRGTPWWIGLAPLVGVVYGALVLVSLTTIARGHDLRPEILPNVLLVGLYGAIGLVLATTQLRDHVITGGWSLSGVSLSAVMLTCAAMHGVYAGHAQRGTFGVDIHGFTIDTLSVPAAVYFLWVVLSLHRGHLRDWNDAAAPAAVAA